MPPSDESGLGAYLPDRPELMSQLATLAVDPLPSYLFAGPSGSGKLSAALAFASMVLCDRGGCGSCDVCAAVRGGHHPDLLIVRRSGQQLEVTEARDAIRFAVGVPNHGAWRIVIIPEIHRAYLAAPILLKTIEEPSSSTIFILTSEGTGSALEPIASRCVRVEVPRPTPNQIASYLRSRGVDATLATRASLLAGGKLDRAEMLAEREEIQRYVDLWRSIPQRLRPDPRSLSELAWELEEGAVSGERKRGGRANSRTEGAEATSSDRRERTELLLLGFESFLSTFLKPSDGPVRGSDSVPLDPVISLEAVERAQVSLARNISHSLVVREFLFDLAVRAVAQI